MGQLRVADCRSDMVGMGAESIQGVRGQRRYCVMPPSLAVLPRQLPAQIQMAGVTELSSATSVGSVISEPSGTAPVAETGAVPAP